MSHSNSSLNCFADCMAKFQHRYILKTPPCKPPSPHLEFGIMAHEVMANAGKLRDDAEDGVVSTGDYKTIIPSEVLYPNLKTEFAINSWELYFTAVIKQVAIYEKELIEAIRQESGEEPQIYREVKVQLSVDELQSFGIVGIKQPIVGVIDLLLITSQHAIIVDYKFSTKQKTQDDFDMDSQLPVYSKFCNLVYDIPLHNIQYGYIDIPKQCYGAPTVLTNGTLSRAKSQNCSQDIYGKAVKAIHGDDPKYNCEPGGYYYDCWCELALNKAAYLSLQWLDLDVYSGVTSDVLNAARMVDHIAENKLPYLRKYSSYSCKGCEYLSACKPWLTVDGEVS